MAPPPDTAHRSSRLVELHVENLAVLARATVLIGDGLTAVTGESGSGKSMLVTALQLLLGGRADTGAVRRNESETRVDARFEWEDGGGGSGETVVTRIVPVDGRSRAYIDGRPSTTAALAETVGRLLDLHGQHEQHRLGTMSWRRSLLDGHCGVDTTALDALRHQMVEISAEIAALGGSTTDRARELDLLAYQIEEIDRLGIDGPDEDTRIRSSIEQLGAIDDIRRRGGSAVELLDDDERLGAALRALDGLPGFDEEHSRLAGSIEDLRDLAASLRRTVDALDLDPSRLETEVRRLAALTDAKRKYGETLAEVLAFRDQAAGRRDLLESHDERLGDLDRRLAATTEEHRSESERVRYLRDEGARGLGELITSELRGLGMEHARITVTVDGEDGSSVEFLFSSGPGERPRPVQRVASGGEAARCMLAIDLVHSRQTGPTHWSGTVVLDEVDSGLGGVAGTAVAEALRELASRRQVIAVTHMATVAAAADQQILVTKSVVASGADGEGIATSSVDTVAGDSRVDELARMLAGRVDDTARGHARRLLRPASPTRRRGSG
jgi:DNA repair protein RecN (Recombination protein N)